MCAAAARCTSGRSDGDRDRRRGCRGGRAQRARRGQPARRRRLGGRRPGGDRPHRRGGPLGRGDRARVPQRPVQRVLPPRGVLAAVAIAAPGGLRPAVDARARGPRARAARRQRRRARPRPSGHRGLRRPVRRWRRRGVASDVRPMAGHRRDSPRRLVQAVPAGTPAVGAARRLRVADALRLARRFLLPVRVLGDELFAGEGAKLLLTGLALHTDLAPDEAGGAAFGWLLAMVGQQYGFPVPVGGAQRIPDALAARLAKRGGRIVTEARVDRVVVGRGRALGVRSADGPFWRASRAVLADVAAPVLYRDLVEPAHLPPRLLADLDRFRWDYATLKVDWALSAPVPWRAATVAGAGTVHLGGDQADLTRYAAALAAGQVPERPFVLLGQMTTADASRSPAGTESMWGYTHLPRRDEWPAGEIDAHLARTERAA